jgi:hypothetical protein
MSEVILNTNTLPEPLLRMIQAERVSVRKTDGVVSLFPVLKTPDSVDQLYGMFSGGGMPVDKFIAAKKGEKT